MKRSVPWPVLAGLLLAALPAAASDIPDLDLCNAEIWYHGAVSLCVVPNGSGDALASARTLDGLPVDATIHVSLNNSLGDPIAGYPGEDIWLESTAGGMTVCVPLGNVADAPTDPWGLTTFSGSLRAGGHSAPGEGLQVYVAGEPASCCFLDIRVNSPDVDGDLSVDLTDLVLFSTGYLAGTYDHAFDYFADGVLDLTDLVVFSTHYNASCP